MQIEELAGFLDWIEQEIRKPNVTTLYQQLFNVLNQNTQPNQPKVSFETQRTALSNGVLKVRLDLLNEMQSRFADQIGLLDLVGQRASDAIDDVLYKNALDIATSAQKIKQFQTSLNTILQKMVQVSEGLSGYVEAEPSEYAEALVHIRFQRDVNITNIVDLKKWGSAWYDIGRGIALAHHLPPEDIKVIGVSRGSIIYDLAVAFTIANTLTGIVLLVLKVADRVLDIRKKAQELRAMKLSNDKAALELEAEADRIEKEGQAEVLSSIKAGKKLDGEQGTALSKAIGKVFDFITGGGEIDIHLKKDQLSDDQTEQSGQSESVKVIAEIDQSFKEIKRLQTKLLLLNQGDS